MLEKKIDENFIIFLRGQFNDRKKELTDERVELTKLWLSIFNDLSSKNLSIEDETNLREKISENIGLYINLNKEIESKRKEIWKFILELISKDFEDSYNSVNSQFFSQVLNLSEHINNLNIIFGESNLNTFLQDLQKSVNDKNFLISELRYRFNLFFNRFYDKTEDTLPIEICRSLSILTFLFNIVRDLEKNLDSSLSISLVYFCNGFLIDYLIAIEPLQFIDLKDNNMNISFFKGDIFHYDGESCSITKIYNKLLVIDKYLFSSLNK